jgi:hypothetical protein
MDRDVVAIAGHRSVPSRWSCTSTSRRYPRASGRSVVTNVRSCPCSTTARSGARSPTTGAPRCRRAPAGGVRTREWSASSAPAKTCTSPNSTVSVSSVSRTGCRTAVRRLAVVLELGLLVSAYGVLDGEFEVRELARRRRTPGASGGKARSRRSRHHRGAPRPSPRNPEVRGPACRRGGWHDRRSRPHADVLVLATDVDAVHIGWGTPRSARRRPRHSRRGCARGVRGRLDGSEGRGRLPVRRGDRRARRDRAARGDPAVDRRNRGHAGRRSVARRRVPPLSGISERWRA